MNSQKFAFEATSIEGLTLVKPFVAHDERGYFAKDYSLEAFEANGHPYGLKEVFYTSSRKGVIRALHFQREIQQPKLVRCVSGKVYDVVVDLRKGSPAFGKWQGFELSERNKDELLIPGGCGHGYLVLEPSIVSYKCGERFHGEYDDGILWNDPGIGIEWPLDLLGGSEIILSDRDRGLQSLKEFISVYGGLR
jgi:dTDP-4-dehydrorhamnose 3,5-epimerase